MSDPDYPLTWPEALMAAKDGAVIECSPVILNMVISRLYTIQSTMS